MSRERRLSDADALALQSTTLPETQAPALPVKQGWAEDLYRYLDHADRAMGVANALRVYRSESDAGVAHQDRVGVHAGRFHLDGTDYIYAGSAEAVTGLTSNTTYLIYAEDDGAGAAQIGANTQATGWPTSAHLKLAEVTRTDGELGAITDLRSALIYQQGVAVADAASGATTADLRTTLNSLLQSLRDAGVIDG